MKKMNEGMKALKKAAPDVDMNYLKMNNIKVFLIGESLMRGSF